MNKHDIENDKSFNLRIITEKIEQIFSLTMSLSDGFNNF